MAQKGRGIFMVYVDIDAQHVQEFDKWYNEEHLPELLSVPGILSESVRKQLSGIAQFSQHQPDRCELDECESVTG
jgi:hypothetical protein